MTSDDAWMDRDVNLGPRAEVPTTAGPNPLRRVLLLDDDPTMLRCMKRALTDRYKVITTTSSSDALGMLAGGTRFDAIICDMWMPSIDGADFYWRVELDCPDQAARIVFVTGGGLASRLERFLVGKAVLPKPFHRDDLLRAVEARCNANAGRAAAQVLSCDEPTAHRASDTPHETNAARPTILLVDDEDAMRAIIRRILGATSFEVLEANCARRALALAAEIPGSIDLLLTDMIMPHGNGDELARQLRSTRTGLRVLYMSGYGTAGSLRGRGIRAEELVSKPFAPSVLRDRVKQALAGEAPR